MKLVIDTSAYSAIFRGDKTLAKQLENEIIIPIIVLAELRSGFMAGSKQVYNDHLLRQFLAQPNVSVTTISDTTTRQYAKIFVELRRNGKPIGTNDMWIAALCLEHNLPLLTLDSDFSNIKNLECLPIA